MRGDTTLRAQAPTCAVIQRNDVRLEVLAQGSGPLVVLLPSLGRGAADFDPIAERLADAGHRVLRPQPRGIGESRGPMAGINLHHYAADVAAVIEHENNGAAFVAGHAFGNRVARMLATDRPELVRAVALIAANIGKAPSPPEVRAAIRASADASLPEAERLAALQFAFFAPGNDQPAIAPRARRILPPERRRSSTCSPVTIRSPMWRTLGPTGSVSAIASRL